MAKYNEGESVFIVGDDETEWYIEYVNHTEYAGNIADEVTYDLIRYDDGSYYSPSHTKYRLREWEIHPMTLAQRVARIEKLLNIS